VEGEVGGIRPMSWEGRRRKNRNEEQSAAAEKEGEPERGSRKVGFCKG